MKSLFHGNRRVMHNGREFQGTGRGVLAAFWLVLCALPVRSEEVPQPLSAREWVAIRAMSRISAYAEVCTKHMPGGKVTWDRALANISATVDRVTNEQLATPRFAGLERDSVPAATAAELRRGVEKARSELKTRIEMQDPDANCPKFLRNAQGFDDAAMRPIVVDALAGFRAMLAVAP